MFYKVITECGHIGAGKGYDKVWFFRGHDHIDAVSLFIKARTLPGVKRKDTSVSIKLITRISREEYLESTNEVREVSL